VALSFVEQLEEMRDLTAQLIQEAHPATRIDVGSARRALIREQRAKRFELCLLCAVFQHHTGEQQPRASSARTSSRDRG
jgi:hypothetical protein